MSQGHANICVCFCRERLPESLRDRFRVEDYDVALQIIKHGSMMMRCRGLAFRVPSRCMATGGMTEYYLSERDSDERAQNRLFVKAWHPYAQEVVKGGRGERGHLTFRHDIRIPWRSLADRATASKLLARCGDLPSGVDPLTTKLGLKRKKSSVPLATAKRKSSHKASSAESSTKKRSHKKKAAVPKKRKRISPDTTSSEEGDTSDTDDSKAAAVVVVAAAAAKEPKICPKGWRGWTSLAYRVVTMEILTYSGLEPYSAVPPPLGADVCVIPLDLALPSLVVGTVIAVTTATGDSTTSTHRARESMPVTSVAVHSSTSSSATGLYRPALEYVASVVPSTRGIVAQHSSLCFKVPVGCLPSRGCLEPVELLTLRKKLAGLFEIFDRHREEEGAGKLSSDSEVDHDENEQEESTQGADIQSHAATTLSNNVMLTEAAAWERCGHRNDGGDVAVDEDTS